VVCSTLKHIFVLGMAVGFAMSARADSFSFSTGSPDGRIATGSRPSSTGAIEIESADDFILSSSTVINHATFYGLIPATSDISDITQVRAEIYRVFPKDSTNPPSGRVPTRANSPSDVAFAERDSAVSELTFSATVVNNSFTASNSVLNGIFPQPNQNTGGEGPVSGKEVLFDVSLSDPFDLPADHYFFVPQVLLSSGNFLWLSAPKPTTPPFTPDLQSWIRNENLAPDWLRIGTDIVGGTTFNAAFSVSGNTVPEPGSLTLLGGGLVIAGVAWRARRARKQSAPGDDQR
jgi:PEP-CTERM motif